MGAKEVRRGTPPDASLGRPPTLLLLRVLCVLRRGELLLPENPKNSRPLSPNPKNTLRRQGGGQHPGGREGGAAHKPARGQPGQAAIAAAAAAEAAGAPPAARPRRLARHRLVQVGQHRVARHVVRARLLGAVARRRGRRRVGRHVPWSGTTCRPFGLGALHHHPPIA